MSLNERQRKALAELAFISNPTEFNRRLIAALLDEDCEGCGGTGDDPDDVILKHRACGGTGRRK